VDEELAGDLGLEYRLSIVLTLLQVRKCARIDFIINNYLY